MLENAAMIQIVAEAAGKSAREFPAADIATLQGQIARPDQFTFNFDYLARALKRRR
jgi:L-fuculose-phosphate aldolase